MQCGIREEGGIADGGKQEKRGQAWGCTRNPTKEAGLKRLYNKLQERNGAIGWCACARRADCETKSTSLICFEEETTAHQEEFVSSPSERKSH